MSLMGSAYHARPLAGQQGPRLLRVISVGWERAAGLPLTGKWKSAASGGGPTPSPPTRARTRGKGVLAQASPRRDLGIPATNPPWPCQRPEQPGEPAGSGRERRDRAKRRATTSADRSGLVPIAAAPDPSCVCVPAAGLDRERPGPGRRRRRIPGRAACLDGVQAVELVALERTLRLVRGKSLLIVSRFDRSVEGARSSDPSAKTLRNAPVLKRGDAVHLHRHPRTSRWIGVRFPGRGDGPAPGGQRVCQERRKPVAPACGRQPRDELGALAGHRGRAPSQKGAACLRPGARHRLVTRPLPLITGSGAGRRCHPRRGSRCGGPHPGLHGGAGDGGHDGEWLVPLIGPVATGNAGPPPRGARQGSHRPTHRPARSDGLAGRLGRITPPHRPGRRGGPCTRDHARDGFSGACGGTGCGARRLPGGW